MNIVARSRIDTWQRQPLDPRTHRHKVCLIQSDQTGSVRANVVLVPDSESANSNSSEKSNRYVAKRETTGENLATTRIFPFCPSFEKE